MGEHEEGLHILDPNTSLTLDEPGNLLPGECVEVVVRAGKLEREAQVYRVTNFGLVGGLILLFLLYKIRVRN